MSHDIRSHIVEFPTDIRNIIVLHHALEGFPDMVLVSKVAEPTNMRHVLADKLIHQATFAKLERRGLI